MLGLGGDPSAVPVIRTAGDAAGFPVEMTRLKLHDATRFPSPALMNDFSFINFLVYAIDFTFTMIIRFGILRVVDVAPVPPSPRYSGT